MTLTRRRIALLAGVPLFSACTRKELGHIARLAEVVAASPGEELTREGEPGRYFFVISDGRADVITGGKKRTTLKEGDFFGEIALLDQGPRSASVVARSPMTLFRIDGRDFGRMLDEVPFVGKKILRGLAQRLRQLQKAPAYVWNRL